MEDTKIQLMENLRALLSTTQLGRRFRHKISYSKFKISILQPKAKCESVLSYNGYDVIVAYDTPDGTITMGIKCPVCGEYMPLKFDKVDGYDY